MKEELKPCPFCGGKARIEHPTDTYEGSQIVCTECGAQSRWVCIDMRYSCDERAISAWNRRYEES